MLLTFQVTKLKFYLDLASVTTITHDLNLDKDDMIRMLTDYVLGPPMGYPKLLLRMNII